MKYRCVLFFIYKNLFHRNVQAAMNQNFKNVLRLESSYFAKLYIKCKNKIKVAKHVNQLNYLIKSMLFFL